jgi:hypothetical protein
MSTIKAINVQHPSSATTNIVNDASGNVAVGNNLTVAGTATVTGPLVPSSSFKRNRIINGNMLIDQRNAGASVTPTVDPTYTLDRWAVGLSQASKFSVQQSSTAPTGFTNSLKITSLSAYAVGVNDYFTFQQSIEGFNIADLGWGTASAKTVTLSFQVYSSLTGTFGGSIINGSVNRSYPFTYSVGSANTWTSISVTIAGDTSGTWNTTTSTGVIVMFGLGVGTNQTGTAGSWAGTLYRSATGAVSIVGTSGATLYITGVQLEVGSKATPYEMQIYSDQLAQCQRYYWKTYNQGTVPGAASSTATYRTRAYVGSYAAAVVQFPVLMRTTPTVTLYNPVTGGTNSWYNTDDSTNATAGLSTVQDSAVVTESSSVTTNNSYFFQIVASAEL